MGSALRPALGQLERCTDSRPDPVTPRTQQAGARAQGLALHTRGKHCFCYQIPNRSSPKLSPSWGAADITLFQSTHGQCFSLAHWSPCDSQLHCKASVLCCWGKRVPCSAFLRRLIASCRLCGHSGNQQCGSKFRSSDQ